MSRFLALLSLPVLALIFALSAPQPASAVDIFQNTCGSSASKTDVCNDVNDQNNSPNSNPIIRILKAAILVVSYIAGVAAVIGIIVSGIRLIVSGGDAQAMASARTGLVYSLIGIAVVALAQVIVIFVLDRI
jgi:hypothetical protein